MIILLGLALLFPGAMGGVSNTLTFAGILFGIVLLHEFGHCIASKSVGGNPDEILIYPLGGLAYSGAPNRPWARFVTVAGGPLVNVLICVITGGALIAMSHSAAAIPWNPLHDRLLSFIPTTWTAYYLWWIFTVSYALLLFNLWPVFPLDGGQMLQSLLWVKFGYYKSMIFACITGMIGAVVMAALGLTSRELLLIAIAISGFMTCYQMYYATRAAGPYEATDEPSYDLRPTHPRRRHLSRWAIWRARKLVREEQIEQVKIDAILAKVSAHGMHSLTWWEKRTLRKATARQRERDAELARNERSV
jgi:Zn-dependent protease